MPQIVSPLGYPGSKKRFAKYIIEIIEKNNLHPELFIEPFAGSLSVSLILLKNNIVDNIGFTDLDPLVSSFWKVLFFDTEWLIEAIDNIEVTIEQWHEYKKTDLKTCSQRELALMCLFLNRTSFSGNLRPEVGPLGGRSQEGKWKIDTHFPKPTIIRRIKMIAEYKQRVLFAENKGWEETVKMALNTYGDKKTLIYFDPPYFKEGDQLYNYYFNDGKHMQLRNALENIKTDFILSYDYHPKFDAFYSPDDFNISKTDFLYIGGPKDGGKRATEILASNLQYLPGK